MPRLSKRELLARLREGVGSTDSSPHGVIKTLREILAEAGQECILTVKKDGKPHHRLEIGSGRYAYLRRMGGSDVYVPIPLETLQLGGTHRRDEAVTASINGLMRAVGRRAPKTFAFDLNAKSL